MQWKDAVNGNYSNGIRLRLEWKDEVALDRVQRPVSCVRGRPARWWDDLQLVASNRNVKSGLLEGI